MLIRNHSFSDYNTNVTEYQTDGQFQAFFGISTTICTATIFFYILLIFILVRKTSLLSGSSFLIIHQMVMEVQIIGIHFPIYIARLHQAIYWKVHNTDEFCRHYMYAFMITVTAVQWGFFSLALNRFVAIHSPHSYKKWIAKKVLAAMAIQSWVMGIGCYMYFYLGNSGSCVALPPYGECDFAHPDGPVFGLMAVLSTYLPLFLTGMLYIGLFVKVYFMGRSRRISAYNDDIRQKAFNRRVRLAKLLCTTTLVHTICFTIIPIMYGTFPGKMHEQTVREWVRLTYFCAYVSTPILYFAMNSDAWNGLKAILCAFKKNAPTENDRLGTTVDSTSNGKPAQTKPALLKY